MAPTAQVPDIPLLPAILFVLTKQIRLQFITGHWSRPRNRTSCSCSSVVAGGSTAQIGTLLDAFTPAECHPYLVNSGLEFV